MFSCCCQRQVQAGDFLDCGNAMSSCSVSTDDEQSVDILYFWITRITSSSLITGSDLSDKYAEMCLTTGMITLSDES